MDSEQIIYENPLLPDVHPSSYSRSQYEGGEDEAKEEIEKQNEEAPGKEEGGGVGGLGDGEAEAAAHNDDDDENIIKIENPDEDDEDASNTDNEAEQKEQIYQEAMKEKQGGEGAEDQADDGAAAGDGPPIKKSDSDNNLLTLEDRVRASTENLEIIRVGEPATGADPKPDDLPVQESQIVNPIMFTQPSSIAAGEDDDDDDDYDIFAYSDNQQRKARQTVAGFVREEPGAQSQAVDSSSLLNPPHQSNIETSSTMSMVTNNPLAQTQLLDQSAVAQSNYMMENGSIMNLSAA